MSTAVNSNLGVQLTGSIVGTALGSLVTPSQSISFPSLLALALTNGTGVNKVNQIYVAQPTLASGANSTLDLYAYGGATDLVGNAITMATVKLICIQPLLGVGSAAETDILTIGNEGSSAGWTSMFGANTDSIKIPAGGSFIYVSPGSTGAVVGASTTNHTLKFAASGANPITYNVIVIGATA